MHYEELAQILDRIILQDAAIGTTGRDLAQALRDGQGYVAIILNPDGLKFTAAYVKESSQQTIHAKTTLRKLASQIRSNSGRA